MTKEEKDKLIELSDLNREDNIKYISSEAQGIAITLDSDRYAPTFCKLERAYICGRRKSEAQIAELEKKNKKMESDFRICEKNADTYYDQLTKAKEHIRTLISCLIDWVQEGDKDYCHIADAEQFIKEIEK